MAAQSQDGFRKTETTGFQSESPQNEDSHLVSLYVCFLDCKVLQVSVVPHSHTHQVEMANTQPKEWGWSAPSECLVDIMIHSTKKFHAILKAAQDSSEQQND